MNYKEKDVYLRDSFKEMYDSVNEKNDVKYILIQTKSAGLIKCNNLNRIDLKIREVLEGGQVENKFWTHELTNTDKTLVFDICQQSIAANMREDVKVFKVLGHEFYYGEIEVKMPKTEIEFRESFCILRNAFEAISDNRYQHLMLRYDDIEFVYTYGYN